MHRYTHTQQCESWPGPQPNLITDNAALLTYTIGLHSYDSVYYTTRVQHNHSKPAYIMRHIIRLYICVPPTVLIKRVIFVCAGGYLCMRACVCMKTFVFQQTAEHKLHIAFSQEIHCRTGCNLPKLYETWHCHHFTTPHNIHTLTQEHTPHPPT